MELNRRDLEWCVHRLPNKIVNLMKAQGETVFVAGGYVRSLIAREEVNDIDCFAQNKEQAINMAKLLSDDCYKTDNAVTAKFDGHVVQFIHRWTFQTPMECIASFDFTIAKASLWWNKEESKWMSHCDDSFYQDLAAKRLVYCKPIRNEDAGGSILRVLKFYQRGYRIPLDSLGSVIARLVMSYQPKPELHSEEFMATVLTGLLIEVDPGLVPHTTLP